MALPYFQMSCNNSESSEDTTCLFFTGGTATQESMFSTVHHDLSVVWLHGSVQIRSILSEALLVSRSREVLSLTARPFTGAKGSLDIPVQR